MKSHVTPTHEVPPCACPELLTKQLRRRDTETQRCPAMPPAQGADIERAVASTPSTCGEPKETLRKLCVHVKKARYRANRMLFRQGEAADAIFYICSGRLHRIITTKKGQERLLAILGPGDFCGEECLSPEPCHRTSAQVVEDAEIARIDTALMARSLRDRSDLAEAFTTFLLTHTLETEAALIDQMVGSVEQRLRRVLLRLARFEGLCADTATITSVKQETLASLVSTTRPRVNYFLNKFRRLGWIDYGRRLEPGVMQVHAKLKHVADEDL